MVEGEAGTLDASEREQSLLDTAAFSRAWGWLDEEERGRLGDPGAKLGSGVHWPLAAGQVGELFGELEEGRLQAWVEAGLLPQGERWWPGAVVMGLLVSKLLDAGWNVQRLREELGVEVAPQMAMLEGLRDLAAERRGLGLGEEGQGRIANRVRNLDS